MTKTWSINTSSDVWGDKDGGFGPTDTDLWLGGTDVSGSDPRDWIGFSVPLAKSKVITSATLYFIATLTRADVCEALFGCEAADNPSAPTTATDLRNRVMTTATNSHTLPAMTAGSQYTFDVTNSVQEILNRAGWVPGNTLAILIWDLVQGNVNRRQVASMENATYAGPILQIVAPYFVPSGSFF